MPISQKSIEAAFAKLGVKAEDIAAAVSSEAETEVKLPDGYEVFTPNQLTARDNIKYNEGKDAGEEMAVKAVKEANNLSFQGKKVEGLFKHLKEQKTPDESETVAQLRKNLEKAEQDKTLAVSALSQMKKATTIHGFIPELNNGMNKSEAMAVLEANGFEFKEEGDTLKTYRNGVAVKDQKMLTDIAPADAIKSFFTEEKKWVGDSGGEGKSGRGGNNSKPNPSSTPKTIKEVQEAWETEHGAGSANSAEYGAHLEAKMKEAKDAGQELQ